MPRLLQPASRTRRIAAERDMAHSSALVSTWSSNGGSIVMQMRGAFGTAGSSRRVGCVYVARGTLILSRVNVRFSRMVAVWERLIVDAISGLAVPAAQNLQRVRWLVSRLRGRVVALVA
jgi:hypothetical protein